MIEWITQNALTLIVIAALVIVIASAVIVLIRDKKKHASSCGGKCSGCPYCKDCGKH